MPIDLATLWPFILIFVLVVVLIFVAIIMFRTARFAILPKNVEPISPVEINAEAIAERLGRAIQFQTIASETGNVDRTAFLGLHRLLEGMFPRLHSSLKREYINEYSLLYTWVGKNPELEPLLMASHLDVVPVDPSTLKEWQYPPFSGQVAEGYVWGRGAIDVKCGVIGLMEGIEYLLKAGFQPDRSIFLAFGHDEETGGHNGAARIASTLKERGVTLCCVLDEGGGVVSSTFPGVKAPVASIDVAEKGYLSLVLEAEGELGNSSVPPDHTSIGVLSQAITRLESEKFPTHLEGITTFLRYIGSDLSFGTQLKAANPWLFRNSFIKQLTYMPALDALMRTTQAVTMIAGGAKDNILPKLSKAVVNYRIYPGETLRSVYEHLVDVIGNLPVKIRTFSGDTLEGPYGWEASLVSDPESIYFAALANLIRRVFPEAAVGPGLATGATDARYYTDICPAIYRFTPLQLAKEEMVRAYGVNERLSIENCGMMVNFFIEFIKEMAGSEVEEVEEKEPVPE
jgi:carboxypeptidase PM20D1